MSHVLHSGLLTRFTQSDDAITLRLDRNPVPSDDHEYYPPMQIITLRGCEDKENVVRELAEAEEDWLEFQLQNAEDGKEILTVFVDDCEFQAVCAVIEVQSVGYSQEDMYWKYKRITDLYQQTHESKMRLYNHITQLPKLRNELEQERSRCQLKLDFLEQHGEPGERLATLRGQIKAFDRALTLIDWQFPSSISWYG